MEHQGHILAITLALGHVKDERKGCEASVGRGTGSAHRICMCCSKQKPVFSCSSSLFIVRPTPSPKAHLYFLDAEELS